MKIGAKVVRQGRYVTFQLAEVAVSRALLAQVLGLIAVLRAPPQNEHDEAHQDERGRSAGEVCQATGKSCLDSWFRRHKRPLGEDGCQTDLDQ